jgi:hypothetical protein
MKVRYVTTYAAALVLLLGGGASAQVKGAKPVKCTNPSTEVTIISGGAVTDDTKGSYQDGVSGVYNTVVYACPGASGDATMGLVTSKRSIGFTFPASDAVNAPAWTNGVKFYAKPFLNVRNILWGRRNGGVAIFTTRMGFSSFNGPGDARGTDYALQFAPTVTDSGVPGSPEANVPDQTVAVTVVDNPRDCHTGGNVLDSWTVTVSDPYVGGLVRFVNNGSPVPAGQYTMPFTLLIRARTCLPPL